MPCFNPLPARRGSIQKSGKRSIIFSRKSYGEYLESADPSNGLVLPCGKCVGCLLKRARDWAVRIHCENSQVNTSSFLTLTFSPKNLPPYGSLSKRIHQLFLKRLRKALHPKTIRYFLCGEYGEKFARPHYHVVLFGEDFRHDRYLWSKPAKHPLYRSPTLEKAWGLGRCLIGDVTLASASYVARYAMKKVYGDKAHAHYKKRIPEYIAMSRRPGIGAEYIRRYHQDVFPSDEVVINGVRQTPPPYYLFRYEMQHPTEAQKIRDTRKAAALKNPKDSTPWRLYAREQVKKHSAMLLYRPYEADHKPDQENDQ